MRGVREERDEGGGAGLRREMSGEGGLRREMREGLRRM